ncbi:NAD(P)/FAD-dependent oxidoreductase [Acaryochloris marina]|uniref:demethylphylloquinone reductase n=1 Tax=Acaryochloris marina (strain MBIC 11017) TaxID=329726 RepID=B0C813_ACAM1|nr:NAD(P)/FAD-dependent oxidoreductase [Acaryochloris marina]ABW27697.1 FAD-dependent pyridine nucleotide-disulphide oxidoreductase [Acaryochloris marina MBIC11017]BDM82431.1 NADH dehydrogenase [Acaryochloris marina MBIC10699]
MTEHQPTICILGGGFGGLYTALRLSQLPWDEQQPLIYLVDQNDHFLFSPLLYELVTGELQSWEIAPPYSELLANTEVRFIQSAVKEIDVAQQQVTLSDQSISYDRLVLALGGETPLHQVPGSAEYALPFRTVQDAYRLEDRLRTLETSAAPKIRVAVVGAGPSGVELACKLADRLGDRGRIRLIERNNQILKSAPEFNQTAAQKALEKRQVWTDLETSIESLDSHEMTLSYKDKTDTLPVDLVLWTVGTAIAAPIQALPLPQNDLGQLLTDSTLQVQDSPHIFALGDLADCRDPQGNPNPKTAQVAIQQADCVGWNLWASLTQRPLLPFHYTHLGEMLTLGEDSAAMSGLGLQLDGPLAFMARRLIYLYRMPTLDHQLKIGFNWMFKPVLSALNTAK